MRYYLRSHSFCVCQYPFVARLLQHIDLNADDLKTFEALIVDEVTVSRRRDLIVDGYEYRKLSFIRDGYAVRYKLLRNGKRQILNVLLPGDIVGIPGSFLERAVYSVTAITDVDECLLARFLRAALLSPTTIRIGLDLDRRAGSGNLCRAHHRCRPPDAGRAAVAFSPRASRAPARYWPRRQNRFRLVVRRK
ncbi:MAG: cyclic nucleotide-binding domain-containing protein [Pseudolabrys sp.]